MREIRHYFLREQVEKISQVLQGYIPTMEEEGLQIVVHDLSYVKGLT